MTITAKDLSLPIPRKNWLAIVDRDATIFSSRAIAYACYEAAFAEVISAAYSPSTRLDIRAYTREYNPLERLAVYRKHYPRLSEEDLKRVGEVSWQYYLAHHPEDRFNRLIPGMDDFLRRLRKDGNRVVILTTADADDRRFREYKIPLDGFFSMHGLKAEKKISATKREAIFYLLSLYRTSPADAVTIGDAPLDHVPEVLSVGTGFDVGCRAAREALQRAARIYVSRVADLFPVFGLVDK